MDDSAEIVLIEDDEDIAIQIITNLKQTFSSHVRHFEDGAAAIDFLFSEEGKTTKLILLDLILPTVDGIEIFKKLKSDPVRKNIPIVILISSEAGRAYFNSFGFVPEGYANKQSGLKNFAASA